MSKAQLQITGRYRTQQERLNTLLADIACYGLENLLIMVMRTKFREYEIYNYSGATTKCSQLSPPDQMLIIELFTEIISEIRLKNFKKINH
jgi:hypothetical protein